ncbi:right-handed parallel beta-helix repeat-containing protein [Microbacterium sp. NPDC019599]|uniref:right-handed parallel beta-helix repeat-containing protein n=1 Tax=Microbacterium sp. NPDC019599 TaxID=3154690 RepID=UPI0033CDB0E7
MTTRRTPVNLRTGAVALALIGAFDLLAGCAARAPETAEPSPTSKSTPGTSPSAAGECPEATIEAGSAQELEKALEDAQPGDVIALQPGTYEGEFVATTSGTEDAPITLCGTPDAILDGGAIDGGYVFHLDGATHWILQGFTVRNGQKGVMADGTTGSVIRNLTVTGIGDEGIHLRKGSTDNQVIGNTVSDTGQRKPKFGEGIYIGTAESNWCDISDCEPDQSDRNVVEGNTISGTTSESVDIKEGTSDGVLRGNTFDGAAMTDADSWVDVKGNGWLIEGNTGSGSAEDGFQTHEILDGWGDGNTFRGNSAELDGAGVGFALEPELDNVVTCDNTVLGPQAELTNVDCTD